MPSWVPAPGTVADISLNTPAAILTPLYGDNVAKGFSRSWSGRAFARWWGRYGRSVGGFGGHGDGAKTPLLGYDVESRLYYLEKPSCPVFHSAVHTGVPGSPEDGFDYVADPATGWMWNDTIESTVQVGEPFTSHFYGIQVAVPPSARAGAPNGWLVTPTRGSMAEGGQRATYAGHRFALGQDTVWTMHGAAHTMRNEHGPSWYDSLRNRVCFVGDFPCSAVGWRHMGDESKGTTPIPNGSVEGYYAVGGYSEELDKGMFARNFTGATNSSIYAGVNIWVMHPVTGNKYRPVATGVLPPTTEEGAWAWNEDRQCWGYHAGMGGNDFYEIYCTGDPTGNNWVSRKFTTTGTARTGYVAGGSSTPYSRLNWCPELEIYLWEPGYDMPAQAFNIPAL